MIPLAASIRWRRAKRRGFTLWIPLLLVWLLLLPLVLVLFPLICVACLFLRVNAARMYATAWRILASLRDTLIEIDNAEVMLRIHIA